MKLSRRNPSRLLGSVKENKRSRRKRHQKDLMHEAKGATLRLNSRIKRGEEHKAGKITHYHCGCGGSGCLGIVCQRGE